MNKATPVRPKAGLLERMERTSTLEQQFVRTGTSPFRVRIDEMIGPVEARIGGRPTLLFGINNYLGLNVHPDVIAAAGHELAISGAGATASRVAGGNHAEHERLEQDVADFFGRRDAIVFSTGFMANLGVITALARPGDAIFFDAHCHASIIDAVRLSGATIRPFAHNDAADLQACFAAGLATGPRTLVVVEGVYSVYGDLADLRPIIACAKRNGAMALVDEAHAFGVIGPHGRGVAAQQGVAGDVDLITGTFSKSIGSMGGFCVTSHPALHALRLRCRSYLFTASMPPALAAAARASLRILAAQDPAEPASRLARLRRNAQRLHDALMQRGIESAGATGPIGGIRMASVTRAISAWHGLLEHGIYVNLLIPPGTPDGEPLLRFSVSALHDEDHIARAIAAFSAVLADGAQAGRRLSRAADTTTTR